MPRNGRSFIGIEGRAASPAEVFDAFVLESAGGPRRHFARSFEVVALPGEAPAEVLPGDLLLRRALGEGGLGSLATIESPGLFGTGRLGRDQMVLRPRGGENAPEGLYDEAAPAYAAAGFVRWLQGALNRAAGTQLKEDGDLGPKTRKALQDFQSSRGLPPSGMVGPQELAALMALGAAPPPGADGGDQKPSWCEPAAARPDGLLGQVFFPTDRYDLDAGDAAALDKLVAAVQALPPDGRGRIKLLGLADQRGSEQHNLQLGQERASAVHRYLQTRLGTDPRLEMEPPVSLGEQPGSGDLAQQRRVDIAGAPIIAGKRPRPPVDDGKHTPPMTGDELERVPPRPALTDGEEVEVLETQLLAIDDPEEITVTLCSTGATVVGDPAQKAATQAVEIRSIYKPGRRLRTRIFPAPPRLIEVERPQRPAQFQEERARRSLPATDSFLPKHLDARPASPGLDPDLRQSTTAPTPAPGQKVATLVLPPENRRVFSDLSYPYCTTGRVKTPVGIGSGTLVGPRHVLTVSHGIPWKTGGGSDWLIFEPAYFDRPSTFGTAGVTQILFYGRVDNPVDSTEERIDYAVLILDKRLGDVCGWMGSRGYSNSWDGKPFWAHIGYPNDLTSAERPVFQKDIALDQLASQSSDRQSMEHKGDVAKGQSGGPFYGWWKGEVGPHVVAVQSSETTTENWASGGDDMVELIKKALKDFP